MHEQRKTDVSVKSLMLNVPVKPLLGNRASSPRNKGQKSSRHELGSLDRPLTSRMIHMSVNNEAPRQKESVDKVSKLATLFGGEEKTKELESIIALKARQVGRLQKEVKSLLKIQQQQSETIESTFEDSKEWEGRIQQYEQQIKIYERTIRSLQDKVGDVTQQYQRLISNHVLPDDKYTKDGKRIPKSARTKLDPMQAKSTEHSTITAPLQPLSVKVSEKKDEEGGTSLQKDDFGKIRSYAEFCLSVTPSAGTTSHRLHENIASACGNLFNAKGTFFSVEKNGNELVWFKESKVVRQPVSGLVGKCTKSGKSIKTNEANKEEGYEASIDDRTGVNFQCMLIIPISLSNGEIRAVLQISGVKSFTEEEEYLFSMAAKQIQIVLDNFWNIETMKSEKQLTDQISEIGKAIASELDINQLAATLASQVTLLFGCRGANFFVWDSSTKEMRSLAPGREEVRLPSKGIIGSVFSTGEMANVSKTDSRFDAEVDTIDEKGDFFLAAPIKNESGETVAVVELINKFEFTNKDIEVMQILGEHIFIALSNSELFHKTLSGFNAALSTQHKYQILLEVAESLTRHLDEDTLISYIMKRARELVNCERCSLFLVDEEKNELESKLAEGARETIRFPKNQGIAGHVATTGEILNIPDAYNDPRFNVDIDKQTGYRTQSLLCMPIQDEGEEIIGVTQLVNKKGSAFGKEDEEILKAFSVFCGICLRNAGLYKQAIQSQYKTKALLDVAVALSSETNIQPLLKSIMKHARKLVKADRASLFMLDPNNNELRSQIAEGTEEIRLPLQGIVGYVAQTGEDVTVTDAYKDPRFNPAVDKATGYNTKSVLCLPIKNEEGKIIAVTQMINKRDGIFQEEDKMLLKAFAAFAAKSLQTTTVPVPMIKPPSLGVDPKYLPTDEERTLTKTWQFQVWTYSTEGLVRCIVAVFESFGLIKEFSIQVDRLVNCILALSRSYRDVPYHNFFHAVDVFQTVYLFLWHGKVLQTVFSKLEILALLVASLCHDIDHGGLNNAFHVKAQTPLALLYKDMSVLETHHCSRSITLLSETDNDILSGLAEDQSSELWKMLIQCILATDMSLHFSLLNKFEALVKSGTVLGEQVTPADIKKLLGCILLKCGDISNVVKPFNIAIRWGEIVCKEFFMQGDIEKAKGMNVSPLMDRDTVVIPQMQLGFINSICTPLFTLLTRLIPDLRICMEQLQHNAAEWTKILTNAMNKSVPNGFWKVTENQRLFLEEFAQKFKIQQPKDWSRVKVQDLLNHGGTSLLNKYYNGSLYQTLRFNFPEINWNKDWFLSVPEKSNHFWQNKENQRAFFESFAIRNNILQPKDWGKITAMDIFQQGGRTLLENYYGKSVFNALRNIFPEIIWQKEWFLHVSQRTRTYWDDRENRRKFLDQFAKLNNVKSPRDWGNVTVQNIGDFKGWTLIQKYGKSLFKVLVDSYPEIKWSKGWFHNLKKYPTHFWNSERNQKEFLNKIAELYNIKEPKEWKRVSSTLIKQKGGQSLLSKYNGSLFNALASVFPNENWQQIEKENSTSIPQKGVISITKQIVKKHLN